jgi:hypothetical protein
MLPAGYSAGAVSKDQAEELLAEIDRIGLENGRYRQAVGELRRVLDLLDAGSDD